MVNVHQRSRLVEEESRERDSKLGGNQGYSPFAPLVSLVETIDGSLALLEIGLFLYLLVHEWNVPVLDLLVEMRCHVGFGRVHIDLS